MNYYDELIEEIKNAIKSENYDLAKKLIDNELSLPYIPSNINEELNDLLNELPITQKNNNLSDELIVKYLNGNEIMQLRAVQELDSHNLRDYIDIINNYLSNDGFINAKVLLIESLIRQEISEDIHYVKDGVSYDFIPRFIRLPEESYGYKSALKILEKEYIKEPSKFELSKELLYKECLLALPISFEEIEGLELANNIISYINNAFNGNLA